MHLDPFPHDDVTWANTVSCIRGGLALFPIAIVETDPSPSTHVEIGLAPTATVVPPGGIAPLVAQNASAFSRNLLDCPGHRSPPPIHTTYRPDLVPLRPNSPLLRIASHRLRLGISSRSPVRVTGHLALGSRPEPPRGAAGLSLAQASLGLSEETTSRRGNSAAAQ